MKHLLLILSLAACAPHVYVKEPHHVEMDRDHRAFVLDRDPDHGTADGDDNGAGSSSSDAVSDDSNGDGSDE